MLSGKNAKEKAPACIAAAAQSHQKATTQAGSKTRENGGRSAPEGRPQEGSGRDELRHVRGRVSGYPLIEQEVEQGVHLRAAHSGVLNITLAFLCVRSSRLIEIERGTPQPHQAERRSSKQELKNQQKR